MEKIVVFGLGADYLKFKNQIFEKYEVVAYSDNHGELYETELGSLFVSPDELKALYFDMVLICSRKYHDAIKIQLIKLGIEESKIISLDIFNEKEKSFSKILEDIELYNQKNKDSLFDINDNYLQIIRTDKNDNAGIVEPHYFAQDIWGAKKILKASPNEHFDIGSRIEGFLSHLLVFREVTYIDIRPLPCLIPGLHFLQSDATLLEGIKDNSIESLSSFHAIEHFGLGRYGDEIDPDAYIKVIKSIQRVIAPKGHVYIGVPVGPKDRLIFNAHRIFSIQTIINLFNNMVLKDIALIKGNNAYPENIRQEEFERIPDYSCCLFEFEKVEEKCLFSNI